MRVELLARAAGAGVAEGPVWDAVAGVVLWVVAGRRVLSTSIGERPVTRVVAELPATAVAPTERDDVLAAVLADGRVALHRDGRGGDGDLSSTLLARVALRDGERLNDGAVDPDGRLWFGSGGALGAAACGRLFALGADGLRCVRDPVGLSNGLGWSPDGELFHWVDTATRQVTTWSDWRSARPRARAGFAMDSGDGLPDGLAVDAGGRLWIATWGGGSVRCQRPDGLLEREIELPRRLVTSCCFAGPALADLAITTAGDVEGDYVPELWLARGLGSSGAAVPRLRCEERAFHSVDCAFQLW